MFKKIDEAKRPINWSKSRISFGDSPTSGATETNLKKKIDPDKEAKNKAIRDGVKNLYKTTNEETMTTVRDIITSSMENNAIDVQSAIHAAIGEKIHDALEAKRVVVAQNLVGIGEELDEVRRPKYTKIDWSKAKVSTDGDRGPTQTSKSPAEKVGRSEVTKPKKKD